MIKISVIKKYLFAGLFCLGLGASQCNAWTDIAKAMGFDFTKEVPTRLVDTNRISYMLFIGFFSALTAGTGEYILASRFASKKNKDQQAKDDQDAAYTKKTWSFRKIPKYVWVGLGLMATGISGIVFSNQLASMLDSVVNKPEQQPAPAPGQK